MTMLVFARDCGPEDWTPLPRQFAAGERIEKFSGHTYGLDRDDAMAGFETVPCTLDGGQTFFTVLTDLLRTEDGGEVCGAYVTPERLQELHKRFAGEKAG